MRLIATLVRRAAPLLTVLVPILTGCKGTATSGTLAGTVVTETGSPVAGAAVATVPATAQLTTDSLGRFAVDFVQPGSYQVRATCAGLLSDSARAVVVANDTASVSLVLRTARRAVAAEMVTTACECSELERTAMYALMDSLGDSLVYVEYHATADTLGEHWEPLLCPAAEQRRLLYCPTFLLGAYLYLDGLTELRTTGFYRHYCDSLARLPSPVGVALSATRLGDSAVTATVNLEAVQSFGPNVGVGMGLYELGPIPFDIGPDTFEFRNVVLDFRFTDTLALGAGETRVIERTVSIPDTLSPVYPPVHVVDKNNIGVYVIVQDLTTRQVLQAAKLKL